MKEKKTEKVIEKEVIEAEPKVAEKVIEKEATVVKQQDTVQIVTPVSAPAKSNNNVWIWVLIIVGLLLTCCCTCSGMWVYLSALSN
jgi:hypothetical protein